MPRVVQAHEREKVGPFTYNTESGCLEELDHNEVRYTAYIASTRDDLMAFLSGRDALPAEMYPHFCTFSGGLGGIGQTGHWRAPSREQDKLEPEVYGGIVGGLEAFAAD